jgi:hypothetical protein
MNVRVARVPFGRIGLIAGRDGSVIEVFRPSYNDILQSEQQQSTYQKPYLISRVIKVDGRTVNVDQVLLMNWDEMEAVLKVIRTATAI